MPRQKITIPFDKGNDNVGDGARLPPGFLRRSPQWIFLPDDEDQLNKYPGRTLAGALQSGSADADTLGLGYLQFDSGTDQILTAVKDGLYYQDAAASLGAWTQAAFNGGANITRDNADGFVRAIPDGKNRWIVFDGDPTRRPLVVNEDGNWRHLSLLQPDPLQYPTDGDESTALQTVQGTILDPDGYETGGTDFTPTFFGDADYGFTDEANAADRSTTDGKVTSAYAQMTPASNLEQIVAHKWLLDEADVAGTTSNHTIKVEISSGFTLSAPDFQVPEPDERASADAPPPVDVSIGVAISTDGGTTFGVYWTSNHPVTRRIIQVPVLDAVEFDQIQVMVAARYNAGTIPVRIHVWDVWAEDNGGQDTILTGTYYYSHLEVYKETLASGKTVYTRSEPSSPVKVVVATSTVYGIQLVVPTTKNTTADGVYHFPGTTASPSTTPTLVGVEIYRSGSATAWPDMGFIMDVQKDATKFTDDFAIPGSVIGVPPLHVVRMDSFGTGIFLANAAGVAPPIYDACIFEGALVTIPADDRGSLAWSMPGMPEYFPYPIHKYRPLSMELNEKFGAVRVVGEFVMVWTPSRVFRTRRLPMADRPDFDLSAISLDVLSPNQGLAGTPLAVATFESQKGHPMAAWVSHNGIWMADGSLVTERGLGVRKLTAFINWPSTVDITALATSTLTYDPVLQILFFDYDNPDGDRRTITFHVATRHWIETGEDQLTPKWTGPHDAMSAKFRIVGELSGERRHFSIDTADLNVYLERTGTTNNGAAIISTLESSWIHPFGEESDFHAYRAFLFHSDWGLAENASILWEFRRDLSGSVQRLEKNNIPLVGERQSEMNLFRAGHSLKATLTHRGKTSSLTAPERSVGPLTAVLITRGESARA